MCNIKQGICSRACASCTTRTETPTFCAALALLAWYFSSMIDRTLKSCCILIKPRLQKLYYGNALKTCIYTYYKST